MRPARSHSAISIPLAAVTVTPPMAPAPALIDLRERQCAVPGPDANAIPRHEFALKDLLGQRVLQLLLDGALQGPRAVLDVRAFTEEERSGRFGAAEDELAAGLRRRDPILNSATPACGYERGTWGPAEADRIAADVGGWIAPAAADQPL